MKDIILVMIIVLFAVMATIIFTLSLLIKQEKSNKKSKLIVNSFEPDNTAPFLTDLREFHEQNKVKYVVGNK